MVRALVPFLIVIWSRVKKAVWPFVSLSVSRVPSLGRVEVMLSECRGYAGTISMLSWDYQYHVELHYFGVMIYWYTWLGGLLLWLRWDCLVLL